MVTISPIDAISKKEEMYYNDHLYNKIFSADRDVHEYLYTHKLVNFFNELLKIDHIDKLKEFDSSITEDTLTKILTTKKLSVGYLSYILNRSIQDEKSELSYKERLDYLNNNIGFYKKALKTILISYRQFVLEVDPNESLLNYLRKEESFNKAKQRFIDNREMMGQSLY